MSFTDRADAAEPIPFGRPMERSAADQARDEHGGMPAPLRLVDAFEFEEATIPLRPWLVRGMLLRGYTHMLAAPGGSGKSLFTLQVAIMLATAMKWAGWQPAAPARTLIINVEDDLDEQHRRLSAARKVMRPDPEKLKTMVLLAEEPDSIVIAKVDPITKAMVATPRATELRELIIAQKIDVLVVDPFAETFEGDENSNSEVKWAMKVWRDDIARPTGCAVWLIHHTNKHSAGQAGSADVIRGAGALVNSTRISSTLFPMTKEDAKALGVDPETRNRFVRFDDAKANQTLLSGTARWFEKESVSIGNGSDDLAADEVGALKPWIPPSAFAGCSLEQIHAALDRIERGVLDDNNQETGDLFTRHYRRDSVRWVGLPIMEAMDVTEEKARLIAETWLKNKLLVEFEYTDKKEGAKKKGLSVDRQNTPTEAEGIRF